MIEREITPHLIRRFEQYPFVTVTGPRQSGKTTLCRKTFPGLQYINLEKSVHRDFALSDPEGFLSRLEGGAILDEIQRVPELLSHLQVLADEKRQNSLFVLTGSQHFSLSASVSQSLAGRTALLHLLPFSLLERRKTGATESIEDILYSGFYPRIYDQGLEPREALADYFETYVERDARQLGEIRNLSAFRRFLRLCAGRVGQLVNLSSLGSDAGVSHTTARHWLTLLEAGYVIFQLPPFHVNIRKRLVKSPKIYFYDVGLASHLIGIERPEQIATHPLQGALFENMVVAEAVKYRFNRGRRFNLSFFRDRQGLETDLLFETGNGTVALEIKSGTTVTPDYFDSLNRVSNLVPEVLMKAVVYGGRGRQSRNTGEIVPFANLHSVLERIELDQEIAVFLNDKTKILQPLSDIRILDSVYGAQVLPILEELRSTVEGGIARLFGSSSSTSYLSIGGRSDSSRVFLEAGRWEEIKQSHVIGPGFKLSEDRKLKFTCEHHLNGYVGRATTGFNLVISLVWTLDASGFSREAVIDGHAISDLSDRIEYSELDVRNTDSDRVVVGICRKIMDEINKRSGE